MDGKSCHESKRIRIQRGFECSRLEQSMLAEAYRRILPSAGLKLVEDAGCENGHGDNRFPIVAPENIDPLVNHSMATGGPPV